MQFMPSSIISSANQVTVGDLAEGREKILTIGEGFASEDPEQDPEQDPDATVN